MNAADSKLLALKTFLFQSRKAIAAGARLRHILPWFWDYMHKFGKPLKPGEIQPSPWLAYSVIQWLENYLHPDMKVFEYGTGASSLFFAPRVTTLISVDHDADWFFTLQSLIRARQSNPSGFANESALPWTYALPSGQHHLYLIPPEQGHHHNPSYFSIQKPAYAGFHFEKYARSIDQFPDNYFDLILLDGRARNACFRHAWPKLKVGAYLLFDDAQREHYDHLPFPDIAKAFTIIGPAPGSNAFHYTAFFRK
jgi:hypothetical protein